MKTKTFTAHCLRCGKEYQAIRTTSLYCSASCRQMVYAKRANARFKEYLQENARWMREQNSYSGKYTVNNENKNANKTGDTVNDAFYEIAIRVLDKHLASTNSNLTSTETELP